MKNYQEYQILNDLSTPAISFDGLEISDRPTKKKNGTQKRPVNKTGTRSTFAFDPVHDIDFKEFLELDTGVEFNREGKMNPCPMCEHNDCCSVIPNEPALMMCFSDEHGEAFNVWTYMEQVHGLTGYDAIVYIANVMGITLSKPSSTRYKRTPELKLLSAQQIINDPRPKPMDLIGDGLLPEKSLLVITGAPKTYKSILALNMATRLASGCDWMGHSVNKPHKCVVLNAEGGYYSIRDRLRRMERSLKQVQQEYLYISEYVSLNIIEPEGFTLLAQSLEEHEPDVLVFDPLVRFHDAEENASNEMAAVMGVLRGLIQQFGISIILVHHDTKGGSPMRGSSVMLGEYDSMMHLKVNREHKRTSLTVEYSLRHAENPPDMQLLFQPDTFSFEQSKKQTHTTREAIIEHLSTGGMERNKLKEVIHGSLKIKDKTISNTLRNMIIDGEINDKDDSLQLVSPRMMK